MLFPQSPTPGTTTSTTSSTTAKTAGETPQGNSATVDLLQLNTFTYKQGPVLSGFGGGSSSVTAAPEPPTSSTTAKTAGDAPKDNSATVDLLQHNTFKYKQGPVPSSFGDSPSSAAVLEHPRPPNEPPMGDLGLDHDTLSAMVGISFLADY
jgi:hypothetical protein